MITNKTIEEILAQVKIEEVVSDFIKLSRRGINYIGVCPFHNEKTPSFTVSPSKNIYKCFGCGEGGNSVHFIMEHEQISYPEALRYLASKYGVFVEETEQTFEEKKKLKVKDELYWINDFSQKYFKNQLLETDYGRSVGLGYFRERNYTIETINKFGLGFANGQNNDLRRELQKNKVSNKQIEELGLVKNNRDFFRNRVIFPIHSMSGKVIGFGGRTLVKGNKRIPKYLNSKESPIYIKNKSLYGIFQARKSIVRENFCYLVEGYTDVLSLYQEGIKNVVASSGTSLTVGQIKLISRFTKNITIIYDGDSAGQNAALKGVDLILEEGMNVKVVLLPQDEDPDSYLKKVGGSLFKTSIEDLSEDFIVYKTKHFLEKSKDDPIKKAELLKSIINSISKISDNLKRSIYVQHCSELLGIKETLIYGQLNKLLIDKSEKFALNTSKEKKEEVENITVAKVSKTNNQESQEQDIIRILIKFGHKKISEEKTVAEFILLGMNELIHEFQNQLYAEVVLEYLNYFQLKENIDTHFFINHSNHKISKLAIDLVSDDYEFSKGWEKWDVYLNQKEPNENQINDAKSCISFFKIRKIESLINRNLEEMKGMQEKKAPYEDILIAMQLHQKLKDMHTLLAQENGIVILK